MPVAFDTLEYSEKLQAVGFTSKQAKVQSEAIKNLIEDNLATKRDLKEMELRIKSDIIKWVAGMLLAQAAIVATLVKLL